MKVRIQTNAGFTLIELMMTLIIGAILLTIAAPSMRDYMASQKVKNGAFDLTAAITFARSEAIKRNTNIDLIPTTTANWASGWDVKAGATKLRTQDPRNGVKITTTLATLTYGGDGRVTPTPASPIKFTVDLTSSLSGVSPRCVTISPSGAPSSTLGSCS